ncbi:MAG: RAD55 family ATPase [Kiritimatiellae bacterium]|nr:RAD55 family ATPase [Kiritimatiellia bacterium]
MITKTPTGIACLDEHMGGTFQGRPLLVTGRRNSGKTIFGLQFVRQGLELGERGLMLSMRPTQDLAIYARGVGLNVDAVVDSGDLMLLEYSDVIPGRDREENIVLPPDGFAQLIDIIGAEFIRRVVIDTVIPWIVMVSREHLAEHIYSFVRAFERLGVTTLFTCSHPASPAAQHAHRVLETNVPVALTLAYNQAAETRQLVLNKYIGAAQIGSMPYRIEQNRGILCIPPAASPGTPAQNIPAAAPAASGTANGISPPPAPPPSIPPAQPPAFAKTASFAASLLEEAIAPPVPPPDPANQPEIPGPSKPNFADAMFRQTKKDN